MKIRIRESDVEYWRGGLTAGKVYNTHERLGAQVLKDERNGTGYWTISGAGGCNPHDGHYEEVPEEPSEPRSPFPVDSAARKEYPVFRGLLEYFPDACAQVAHLSYLANQKHNPDEPMHWARDKSSDHKDCEMRHAMEHDYVAKAWRALADLQIEMEKGYDPEREYKQYRNLN